jgi:hypothetical protein
MFPTNLALTVCVGVLATPLCSDETGLIQPATIATKESGTEQFLMHLEIRETLSRGSTQRRSPIRRWWSCQAFR